jgi:DNA-binding NarL/FixJ family response regulator
VLSARQDDEYVVSILRAGANGYLLTDARKEECLVALKSTLNGKNYLSPDLLSDILSAQVTEKRSIVRRSLTNCLTSRERQIMKLIAEGKRSRAIADCLSISVKTVECHRTNLMKKLNLHSVAEVTAFVIKNGYSNFYLTPLIVCGWA